MGLIHLALGDAGWQSEKKSNAEKTESEKENTEKERHSFSVSSVDFL
jgi:hypothetical protein